MDGRRRFKGRLLEFRDREVVLLVDGQEFRVPFNEIEKANSMYEFSRADFATDKSKSQEGKGQQVKSGATS